MKSVPVPGSSCRVIHGGQTTARLGLVLEACEVQFFSSLKPVFIDAIE